MKVNKAKIVISSIGMVTGIGLVVLGLTFGDHAIKVLMGICLGLGAGLSSMFLANMVNHLIEVKNPEIARTKSIAVHDERNTTIRDRAGAQTNRVLRYVLPLVAMVFALLNVHMAATFIVCGLVLLQGCLSVYFFSYYNKKM